MTLCLIDDSLATAMVTHPLEQGWVASDDLEPVSNLTAEMVEQRGACALLGSVEAALLADRYALVADFALVSHHSGAIVLWTSTRPDEVEAPAVALDGVSRTAEAVARVTLPHFYGIKPTAWERESAAGDVVIREGAPALRLPEVGQINDLVRAWFILTGFPLPTHMLVVPKGLAEQDAEAVSAVVDSLKAAYATGAERRRDLRRNLAGRYDLDRQLLADFQSDQTTVLSKTVRKAWLDLLRRVGRAMKLPEIGEPAVVTVEQAE